MVSQVIKPSYSLQKVPFDTALAKEEDFELSILDGAKQDGRPLFQ
jgi:hypothetical protein